MQPVTTAITAIGATTAITAIGASYTTMTAIGASYTKMKDLNIKEQETKKTTLKNNEILVIQKVITELQTLLPATKGEVIITREELRKKYKRLQNEIMTRNYNPQALYGAVSIISELLKEVE